MKRGIFVMKSAKDERIDIHEKGVRTNATYGYLSNPDNLAVFQQFGWVRVTKSEVDSDKGDQWELIHSQYKLSEFLQRFPLD